MMSTQIGYPFIALAMSIHISGVILNTVVKYLVSYCCIHREKKETIL